MHSLLDVNVLVALALKEHEHHERVHRWFHKIPERPWATCPLTQAGFVRAASFYFGDKKRAVHLALKALEDDCGKGSHVFWNVEVDLRMLDQGLRNRMMGPGQMADVQLLLTAFAHGSQLATLDRGISALVEGTEYESSVLLLK